MKQWPIFICVRCGTVNKAMVEHCGGCSMKPPYSQLWIPSFTAIKFEVLHTVIGIVLGVTIGYAVWAIK